MKEGEGGIWDAQKIKDRGCDMLMKAGKLE
jgi:hypothetical protein